MDLNKSAYLLALAELKSFSKAAEKCYVSQPALTRYIKNLEEEVGLKLVDRSSSPVRLTYEMCIRDRYMGSMDSAPKILFTAST